MNEQLKHLPLLLLVACGSSLLDEPPADPIDEGDTRISARAEGDVTTLSVDATDTSEWVFLGLGAMAEVMPADPMTDLGWDLGFRRSNIRLSGGMSGPGQAAIVPIPEANFDDITAAPADGWITDERLPDEIGDDGSPVQNDGIAFAFTRETSVSRSGWFLYDGRTHVLSPAPIVFAVRGAEGGFFALEVLDWYDAAGTSGVWTLRVKRIAAPEGEARPGFAVDASARGAWVYLRLADREVVTPASPETSLDWDLALSRTQIRTNSGASGSGLGGARLAPGPWGSFARSPTSGFVTDELLALPGPPGSGSAPGNRALAGWFDYDPMTRSVSPKPSESYLVRAADGTVVRLRVLEWEDGIFRLETARIDVAPDRFELEVDAASGPALVSLRLGAVVETATAGTGWDLAFSRTRIRTNSGVSGPGEGGAREVEAASLDEVQSLPEDGFDVDSLLESGRPGVEPAPGNPALARWFDYDPSTHSVSPKAQVFAVRTADGHLAAVQVLEYQDGRYRIAGIFAGPGRSAIR